MTINRFACLLVLLISCAGPAWARSELAGPAQRPNIVYIVSDDQGWKDVGFHGSDIKTPNIDRLANEGVRMDRFYAQPMCTPSRAALLTGRYPDRYGLQTLVIPSAGKYGLATDEWLMPQSLQAAGYRTAIVGKWHLGHADRKYWPRQRGFDYQYGPIIGEIDYFTHSSHGVRDWFRNNEPVREEGYVTQLLGDDAVRWIDQQNTDTPFFLYLAFTAPHAPYQAPQAYMDAYKHVADPSRRAYSAMITAMDEQVGRVVDALKRRGLRDNTLIVFQSDNGGTRDSRFTGEVDMSKSVMPADNSPYRDGKASLYEGGTRVVALANWPGHIQPGVVTERIHITDMFPTIAALAGASTAESKPLDGFDVWPVISRGAPSPRTQVVYGIEPYRAAVSDGDWKLVWKTTLPSTVELFNLADDPGEKTNLADSNPEVVTRLKQLAEANARKSVAPLILAPAIGEVQSGLFGAIMFPDDIEELEAQP